MTIKLILKGRMHGSDIVNTLHYVDVAGTGGMTPDEMAQEVVDAYTPFVNAHCSNQYSLTGIDWVDPDAGGGQPALPTSPSGLPLVGGVAANAAASQVAGLINWKSIANAPWQGKTYLGGVAESQLNTSGDWEVAFINAADTLANALIDLSNGSGGEAKLVIRSRGTATIPAGQTAVVDTGIINPVPATLRRRKKGVGS